ncbi:uncharacterized protein N7483_000277 [Penicillium malachiteum]|uniref:uncharacterized protein n=1 Tax=Penicillium malachiteum TaxID=1324776 RepID=UPI00254985EA|nr:uncharacterized protein N7483_000277 [Penicillium malachiteum]KAJ5735152.1 hypothetical protein N7483_000277 [Penicillium malachiteum]
MQDPRLSNITLTRSEVERRPTGTLNPSFGQRPQDNPTGFAQFLMMVLGFEVLLQHRAYGSQISQGTEQENER